MKPISYLDRTSGQIAYEKVYGGKILAFLYGGSFLGNFLKCLISKNTFVSSLLGVWHKRAATKKNILPFIQEYGVNPEEFLLNLSQFTSFNDFFIRKLKPNARPISSSEAVIPADARFWFYDHVDKDTDFIIKGERLNFEKLLGSKTCAEFFKGGSVAIARLCPSDYHRFHFPVDCIPGETQLINGPLFSVNPLSLKQNLAHLTENKRKVTLLESVHFGKIAYVEIGATSVGTIQETFIPFIPTLKGSEKGYFEFGGSALILLFQPGKIIFAQDLLQATQKGYEILCQMGQNMGLAKISEEV